MVDVKIKKVFYGLCLAGILMPVIGQAQTPNFKQLMEANLNQMVKIPGGTYTMGATRPDWQSGNTTPPHKVTLSAFYMGKFNISYGLYDAYTALAKKTHIQKDYDGMFFRNAEHPVNVISWYQANDYCEWLAKKTGLPFSLPTEAQYEYVARDLGKPNWAFATNNGKQELGKNFPNMHMFTHQKYNTVQGLLPLPVGSLPCTPMGICGLNGEVDQWMKDWYDSNYYGKSPTLNPQGPKKGNKKSVRGGSYQDSPEFNNVYGRFSGKPSRGLAGFRCVINSDKPMSELKAIAERHLNQ